jgi:cellulose synthase/poly-beta-1,6-N-acetylglucosamine synthase-like glycosyltransferase
MREIIYVIIVTFSVVVTFQSAHVLYLTMYTYNIPPSDSGAPEVFQPPRLSFTVMLPARHEEPVIGTTIGRIARANYPPGLLQILVVCAADDEGTIAKAEAKIRELGRLGAPRNISMVVFHDGPINKPHGLNAALAQADKDIVTIFDAEDDIHPDVFNLVNTVMVNEQVRVVQAGVQLMNFDSSWWSALNILEYFFWFRSRLHYHARSGATPLGGNTVFFNRDVIRGLGGWDEHNLTEDADIGLRLSAAGEKIRIVYDHRYVTKEETPPTIRQFVKQRTRWSQGFMQTRKKGTWRDLPTRKQRFLAFYTLFFPQVQAFLGFYIPISLLNMFFLKTPVLIAMISFFPVVTVICNFLIYAVGIYQFANDYGLKASPDIILKMFFGWLPYQLLVSFASIRATLRQLRGISNWEKTKHIGAHREPAHDRAGQLGEATSRVALFQAAADKRAQQGASEGAQQVASERAQQGASERAQHAAREGVQQGARERGAGERAADARAGARPGCDSRAGRPAPVPGRAQVAGPRRPDRPGLRAAQRADYAWLAPVPVPPVQHGRGDIRRARVVGDQGGPAEPDNVFL